MKQLQKITLAVLAALAIAALAGVSSASATTLETKGVAENAAITLKTSIVSGGSLVQSDTSGVSANTCASSALEGTTSAVTGSEVNGSISALSWSNCTHGNPTADAMGSFIIMNISGTTNGTVRWNGSKWTIPSVFGTITCTTSNTDIGTLEGVKEGTAHLAINAVFSCSVIGSLQWSGTYTFTGPADLGVTA